MLLSVTAVACASTGDHRYQPTRVDYIAFRQAHPELLEPNYLPFMLHAIEADAQRGEKNLVLCRWSPDAMPLSVAIDEPEIPEKLQNEIRPIAARSYVRAVERALSVWQGELEGLVSFREPTAGEAPALRVRLLAKAAPTPHPDIVVLGSTEALLGACRPAAGRNVERSGEQVQFAVPELVIYTVDEFGLLAIRQVEQIALHEIGHALGMLGHSPSPSDLMYAAYREQSQVEGLSPVDANSFVDLYTLPNGTVYRALPPGADDAPEHGPPPAAALPPSRQAQLAPAPFVAPQHGFSLRLPEHWVRLESEHGVFAANGPLWDHDVSLEVFVWPADSIEAFLGRHEGPLLAGSWRRRRAWVDLRGHRALEIEVEGASGLFVKQMLFIECPEREDGRGRSVMLVLAQAPADSFAAWKPWFDAVHASIDLWQRPASTRSGSR